MDWIEAWFGLNPDGGDGSIEALVIVAAMVVAMCLVVALSGTLLRRVASSFGRGAKAIENGRDK